MLRFIAWVETNTEHPWVLPSLTRSLFERYVAQLPDSLQREHRRTLHDWCEWMTSQGYLSTNPIVLPERQRASSSTVLTSTQTHDVMELASGLKRSDRVVVLLHLLLYAGLTLKECALLTWRSFRWYDEQLLIAVHQGDATRERWIPAGQTLRLAVARYSAGLLHVAPAPAAVASVWPPMTQPQPILGMVV